MLGDRWSRHGEMRRDLPSGKLLTPDEAKNFLPVRFREGVEGVCRTHSAILGEAYVRVNLQLAHFEEFEKVVCSIAPY